MNTCLIRQSILMVLFNFMCFFKTKEEILLKIVILVCFVLWELNSVVI